MRLPPEGANGGQSFRTLYYVPFLRFSVVSSSLPLRFRPQRGAKPTTQSGTLLCPPVGAKAKGPSLSLGTESPLGIYSGSPSFLRSKTPLYRSESPRRGESQRASGPLRSFSLCPTIYAQRALRPQRGRTKADEETPYILPRRGPKGNCYARYICPKGLRPTLFSALRPA